MTNNDLINKIVSENIRKYRKLNAMSQEKLAEMLEVTRQSISLWETGECLPSIYNIVSLSELFNVTPNDLLIKGNSNPLEASLIVSLDNKKNKEDLFKYLKNFAIQNGTINGDYCYYSNSADNYGGDAAESFSLYYWGDSDKVDFCLHRVIDDTFSINFYLYPPKTNTGKYEYVASYYYRDNGEPLYQAEGIITASEFTKNYPLNCTKYIGSTDKQNEFMEMSRQGVCNLISCIEKFTQVEKLEYSFSDFGFTEF